MSPYTDFVFVFDETGRQCRPGPLLRSCRLVVTNENVDAYNHRD